MGIEADRSGCDEWHELHHAIEAVEPDPTAVAVGELLVARERLEARLCAALSGFLSRGLHRVEGWGSPVGWLKAQGVSDADAKRLAVRAARLAAWPALAASWFDGEVSAAQVEVVVRRVPAPLVDLYGAHDAEVSPYLVALSVADTARAVRDWVVRAEAVVDGHGAGAARSGLSVSRTLDGRAVLDGELDPDTAALTETALRVAERPDEPGEIRTARERCGEAFTTVVRFFCDHFAAPGARPARQHPHVAVTIDPDDLIAGSLRGLGIATADDLERFLAARSVTVVEEGLFRDALAHAAGVPVDHDGHPLRAASLATLFTEGTLVHRLLVADGQVIDRGRDVRLASPDLRDAMVARDRGCRFPRCDAPTAWVHAHHLRHWEHGGATDLANLAGLCAAHHGVVHRQGWDLTLEPDATLVFRRPDGTTLASPPPRRRRPSPLPLHHPRRRGLIPELPVFPVLPETGVSGPAAVAPGVDAATPVPGEGERVVGPGEHEHEHEVEGEHEHDAGSGEPEPSVDELDRMVRARVVDLVVRHHRRRPPPSAPDPWVWPEAG